MKISEIIWNIGFFLFADLLKKRFLAGQTIDDAIRMAKELEKKEIYSIVNILGENVKDEKEAARFRDEYLKLIYGLVRAGLHHTHISVKPSQLGLEISKDLYKKHLNEILEEAKRYLPDIFVEIDREGRDYIRVVREVSPELSKRFSNQRLCCQINLQETWKEIKQLSQVGISIRLCKGTAYPGDIKDETDLRRRFLAAAHLLSKIGTRPAIATHDLHLIDKLRDVENLEFQVLLGIENKEMEKLAQNGETVGFYLACGPDWKPFGKRRGKVIFKIWLRNWWYRIKKGE